MNTLNRTPAPTRSDFEAIANAINHEITEYVVAESGEYFHVTMVPPATDEMLRDQIKRIILLCAQYKNSNWEIWSSDNVKGMKIIGEIPPNRHLAYRYIIGIPT